MSASAFVRSFSDPALIFTFIPAPSTAARAANAPTPASDTLLGLPFSTILRHTANTSYEAFIVSSGTSVANSVAVCIASVRAAFSSGVFLGIPKAAMMRLNASVSSSTRCSRRSCRAMPSSATWANSLHRSSHPGLWLDRFATIVANDAPSAPI